MGFILHTTNKLEKLAADFCQEIYNRPLCSDPMSGECVVVQTQGMAAFLRQTIAAQCGVASNIEMPFPNAFAENLIAKIFPDFIGSAIHFSQENMSFEIYSELEKYPDDFPELKSYIEHDQTSVELHRWQLSSRIAALFDSYQMYRYKKQFLTSDSWQRRLWKKLEKRNGVRSKDHYYKEFLTAELPEHIFSERISVFGVGSLPPLYLDIFFKIAEYTDVHFFYLTPCQEYWEHLYSEKEKKWKHIEDDFSPGNPLLASWGESGRELFSLLLNGQDQSPYVETSEFIPFAENDECCDLLKRIQQDIFDMRDARDEPENFPSDDSVGIFNCYFPRREVEILHDKLLKAVALDGIELRNIIVMAPDINIYAPLIEAVFALGPLQGCYTIADRNLGSTNSAANCLKILLNLPESRFAVSEVLGLLANPVCGDTWKIGRGELDNIRNWVKQSGICWGVDGDDRKKWCDVEFDEFSWMPILEKMMMKFADADNEVDKNIGSIPVLEEGQLGCFGRFYRFLKQLVHWREVLQQPADIQCWICRLLEMIDVFFTVPRGSAEIVQLRQYLTKIGNRAAESGFTSAVPLNVVQDLISSFMSSSADNFSFLRGKITFCSLTPLRSIPADVIAILGLNEGEFPRRDKEIGFNMMIGKPLPGDRSIAREDRYLFLEALMSARKHFWLFYDGHTLKSNRLKPPSTLVSEFANYIKDSYGFSETQHKLQPFDPIYFSADNGQFYSYSPENFLAASALADRKANLSPRREFREDLVNIKPEIQEFGNFFLTDIIKWAKNPAVYFFKSMLDVSLKAPEAEPDSEPLVLDSLEKYNLRKIIFSLQHLDISDQNIFDELKNANKLPLGLNRSEAFADAVEKLNSIKSQWRETHYSQERRPIEFEVGKFKISGVLTADPSFENQQILSMEKFKHETYVDALIRHHAFRIVSDAETVVTTLIGYKDGWSICREWRSDKAEISASQSFWKELLKLFLDGRYRIPALFPRALFAYCDGKEWEKVVNEFNSSTFCDLNSNIEISRVYEKDALDDPAVRAEFEAFAKFFYDFSNSNTEGEDDK